MLGITFAAHRLILLAKFMDFPVIERFEIQYRLLRRFRSANQFVELHVDDVVIPVLGVLDQENHQKCDDGGRRVDDKLPGIIVVNPGPRGRPNGNQHHGDQEGARLTGVVGEPLAELGEFHDVISIAIYRV